MNRFSGSVYVWIHRHLQYFLPLRSSLNRSSLVWSRYRIQSPFHSPLTVLSSEGFIFSARSLFSSWNMSGQSLIGSVWFWKVKECATVNNGPLPTKAGIWEWVREGKVRDVSFNLEKKVLFQTIVSEPESTLLIVPNCRLNGTFVVCVHPVIVILHVLFLTN